MMIWRSAFQVEKSRCSVPGMGANLACSRNPEKTSGVGMELAGWESGGRYDRSLVSW